MRKRCSEEEEKNQRRILEHPVLPSYFLNVPMHEKSDGGVWPTGRGGAGADPAMAG